MISRFAILAGVPIISVSVSLVPLVEIWMRSVSTPISSISIINASPRSHWISVIRHHRLKIILKVLLKVCVNTHKILFQLWLRSGLFGQINQNEILTCFYLRCSSKFLVYFFPIFLALKLFVFLSNSRRKNIAESGNPRIIREIIIGLTSKNFRTCGIS